MQINWEMLLSGIALLFLGAIGLALIWFSVPETNQQLVTFVLGALSGAVTVAGGKKVTNAVGGGDATQG